MLLQNDINSDSKRYSAEASQRDGEYNSRDVQAGVPADPRSAGHCGHFRVERAIYHLPTG